jgi:hypothetical protein
MPEGGFGVKSYRELGLGEDAKKHPWLFPVFLAVFIGMYLLVPKLIQAILQLPSRLLITVCLTFGGVSVAGLLFWLRNVKKGYYGLLECAFALVSLGRVSWNIRLESESALQLIGCIYILVRGFVNIYEAEEKDSEVQTAPQRPIESLEQKGAAHKNGSDLEVPPIEKEG